MDKALTLHSEAIRELEFIHSIRCKQSVHYKQMGLTGDLEKCERRAENLLHSINALKTEVTKDTFQRSPL